MLGARLVVDVAASPTGNALEDLDLFAVVAHDQATHEDDALVADAGALVLILVIVIAVIVIGVGIVIAVILVLTGWMRVGCARLCGVHWGPFPVGRVPGSGRLLRGHFFIRRPHSSSILVVYNYFIDSFLVQ